ncbi:MAG: 1,4-alpha-glucan branching protein GlgB [Verrucomicrobiota bacterium]|nr:1,4-alpha-glucan branching protein GlgB [Verrucomicrobiota bacterium]
MHLLADRPGLVVRAWDPSAQEIALVDQKSKKSYQMIKIHDDGFFEFFLPRRRKVFPYFFYSIYENGERKWLDPYSFEPSFDNSAYAQFNNGRDRRPFDKMGAIPLTLGGVDGVAFVVWAPAAKSVHLVGDFNHWNQKSLPMRALGSSGCRELFVPFANIGDKYKFRILGSDGILREKTDPFGWRFESPPGNASIIQDREALISRKKNTFSSTKMIQERPLSIYEMHLGSWRSKEGNESPLSYVELAEVLPDYLKEKGFTHVEFLPPTEYPYGASWGYQVTGYYAPTFRYGTPDEFGLLVSALQNLEIGVLIDWVPAHFPSDDFFLSCFDGTCLFEHEDPRQGLHAEWGTLCYNYGRPEVRSFLIGSAIAWLDRFGVDGFRVDAVASMLYLDYGRKDGEWIPNSSGGNYNLEAIEFIKQFNEAVHEEYPEAITIAEESTAFPQITQPPHVGGLGFDFKWNMGWMHDVIDYFSSSSKNRSVSHDKLTFGAMYQFSENFVQAFSHDEVVHGKGSLVNKMNQADPIAKLANLRALYALQWAWPGKKTLFMGSEFGQWKEWDFDSSLDWALLEFPLHRGLSNLIGDLNSLYISHPTWALNDHNGEKFEWVDCNDAQGQTLSFLKFGNLPEDTLLVACNFSDQLRHRDWGCPHKGKWRVILDTDSSAYGGQETAGVSEFNTLDYACNNQTFGLSFSVGKWSVRILSLVM